MAHHHLLDLAVEDQDNLMRIISNLLLIMVLVPLFINAQSINDAVNWSFENESGNSRYESMAGAFGALGGNLSALSSNPASGAVFELSRFGVSLIINDNSITSTYNNNQNTLNSGNSNYQAGLVYVFKNYGNGDLNKFSIGINFQSISNFNEEVKISGRSQNSVDNFFLNNSSGVNVNNISVGSNETVRGVYKWLGDNVGYYAQQAFLGYQSYLLNYDSDKSSFYSLAKYDNGVSQDHQIFSNGFNNQASFNLSWQYKENFYWGINLNFNDVLVEKELRHIESNFDSDSPITDIDFRNYLTTKGTGISVQGGLIYKIGTIRIGVSYSTPTYYKFEDILEQYIKTSSIDVQGVTYTDIVDPRISNIYNYNFKSPSKLNFSVGSVINNMILISADVISKNYSKSKFEHQNNGVYNDLNSAIGRNLTNVIDYKIGTEIKLNQFSIRAGYKALNNPYKNGEKKYITAQTFGLGYNFNSSILDFAIVNSKNNYNYQLFDTGLTESANINNKRLKIVLSYNIIF